MTEKVINDLANHISKYIAGKHKLGTAHKIINLIWAIAYEHGHDAAKKELDSSNDF